jgi:hypothetical protein
MNGISKTPWWVFALIALLCLIASSLIDLEKEAKLQRTPEQAAAIEKQDARNKQFKEIIRVEQEARAAELKDKSWSEVGFTEEAIHKFIAHGYALWVFGGVLILSGPLLMRKRY